MPTQTSRLNKTKDQEYRARLSRIKNMGIPVGRAVDPLREPDRLMFEQTESELSSIYELPLGEGAVVVPARMTILPPGTLITAAAMMVPWEESHIDLWDDLENPYYRYLVGMLYHQPPTFLNDRLTSGVPLRPRQVEGVIIAHGSISVPPRCHDGTLVTVQLILEDERRNKLRFDFRVGLDRSVVHKWEKRHRERLERARSIKGGGLYAPKRGQPGDQKRVSRGEAIKPPHASGEHDATWDSRTPEPKLGDQ
jgi:hypothetical protein